MLKDKIIRYKLIEQHRELVRTNKFFQARLILKLLSSGQVKLWLDDDSYAVETICEKIGCTLSYSRNGNSSIVYIY